MNKVIMLLVLTAFLVTAIGCASPLHYHIQEGNANEVSRLIAQGADVNEADFVGMTPLMYSANNGYFDLALALLNHGADVNKGSGLHGTPLIIVATQGHTQVAALLLERGANVNAETSLGQTPLERAAYFGHADIVKMLLDKGADADVAISNLTFMSSGEKTDKAVALVKSYLTAGGTSMPSYPQTSNQSKYSEGTMQPAESAKPMQAPYSF